MEFILKFKPKEIAESRELTSQAKESFTFNKGEKSAQLNIQFSFLLSKLVQEMINQNPQVEKYDMPEDACSDDFFDYFFQNIENDEIHISTSQIRDFASLIKILKIERLNPSIDSAIISLLCEPFPPDNFSNDQERLTFLCHHLNEIDVETLLNMPSDCIQTIITDSQFQNDDEHAKFLLKDPELFQKKFLKYVNFDNLSNPVMTEVLSHINFDLSQEEQEIMGKITERLRKDLSIVHINVLIIIISNDVISPHKLKNIDFSFIDYLNKDTYNRKYQIHYKTMVSTDFNEKQDYMKLFDVVVLGGCDSYGYFNPKIKQAEIFNYHNLGGILLFLHDVVYAEFEPTVAPLARLVGYGGNIFPQGAGANEVHLKEECEKNDILSTPFEIENPFKVAPTHRTPNYVDQNYEVLLDENNNYYYVENLDEHVGDCIMGHSHAITEAEQKFFYNLICHLYRCCHGNQVKTTF